MGSGLSPAVTSSQPALSVPTPWKVSRSGAAVRTLGAICASEFGGLGVHQLVAAGQAAQRGFGCIRRRCRLRAGTQARQGSDQLGAGQFAELIG
jgi:hypothetical protein